MGRFEVLTGNEAIAWGVRLCRPQVIAAYPITPQSEIVETLSRWIARGELDAEYINVEGEFSAGGATMGACDAGARVFTATCAQGLGYGFEYFAHIGWSRLPVVMAVTNRALGGYTIYCDHRDSLSLKDHNWIQFYCENHQESLDTVIQAYKVAEDLRVSMPAMVCIDGFYLSHTTSIVEIPEQELVSEFLPPPPRSQRLMIPPMESEEKYEAFKAIWARERLKARINEQVKPIIEEVDREFGEKIGRSYGGLIEAYRCDDAEIAIVAMGSMVGTVKDVVDEYRDKNIPVGLIKLRVLRPFPTERIRELAKNIKVMVALDRNTAWGSPEGGGVIFEDLKSALYSVDERPLLLDFIVGLLGIDVTEADIKYAIAQGLKALKTGEVEMESDWLYWGQPYDVETIPLTRLKPHSVDVDPRYKGRIVPPGDLLCPGCVYPLAIRYILENLGKIVVPVEVVGCRALGPLMVGPWCQALFSGGACYASGVSRALKVLGKKEGIEVIYCGGDGGIADVGFQPVSGAAERNEDMVVVCLDNEAYMNTGIQRSSTTPLYAWTTTTHVGRAKPGKLESKKDMPLIMASHNVPYVATASVSHIQDLIHKAKKVSTIRGFRYLHILIPCSQGWRFPPEKTIEMARLAVQTGYFPLFEIEDGRVFRFTVKPSDNPRPIIDFLKPQGRFAHLSEAEIQEIQKWVNARLQYYRYLDKFREWSPT
jgi:pyruvate ferredoxin oxidoreductase alpha subunit